MVHLKQLVNLSVTVSLRFGGVRVLALNLISRRVSPCRSDVVISRRVSPCRNAIRRMQLIYNQVPTSTLRLWSHLVLFANCLITVMPRLRSHLSQNCQFLVGARRCWPPLNGRVWTCWPPLKTCHFCICLHGVESHVYQESRGGP